MVDVLAKVLSYIFHPLLLATYLFGLLTLTLPAGMDPLRAEGHWNFVFLIFCVTFLLPAFNILIFKFFVARHFESWRKVFFANGKAS